MHVAILGSTYDIDRDQVVKAIRRVSPEPIGGQRKYYVELNGQRYPIKQVIGATLGIPRVAFTATHAYHILTRLGFEVQTIKS